MLWRLRLTVIAGAGNAGAHTSAPTKDETFVLLRGRVRLTTHNDDGSVKNCVVLCPEEGVYGVNIPKGVWHTLESLESGSVFFECKEGPFVGHEVDERSAFCLSLGSI